MSELPLFQIHHNKSHTHFIAKPLQTQQSTEFINKSIFTITKMASNLYKDKDVGPRFDQNGKILKYSIIGNPEIFLNRQRKSKVLFQTQQTTKVGSPIKIDNNIPVFFQNKSNTKGSLTLGSSQVEPVSCSNRLGTEETQNQLKIIQTGQKKAKLAKQVQTVSKQQIIQDLYKTEQRIKMGQMESQQKLKTLNVFQYHNQTRQERALQIFDKNDNFWKKQVTQISIQTSRPQQQSLMIKLDSFRKQTEEKKDVSSDNHRYWYQNLRNQKSEIRRSLPENLFKKLPTDVFVRTDFDKEINPSIIDSKYKHKEQIFKSSPIEEVNKCNIIISGINKLKIEKQSLNNDKRDLDQCYIKFRQDSSDQSDLDIEQYQQTNIAKLGKIKCFD